MIVRRGHRRGKAKCGTNRPSAEKNLCGGFGRGDGIIFASTGKRKVEVFMRGSMASRTQASARVNRQPRIKRRIFKRFGGCGSNLSQQQRPRDGKNAISGSWSRRRDLRLWRRALVGARRVSRASSPLGSSSARYRSTRAGHMFLTTAFGSRATQHVGERSVFRPDVRKEKGGFGLLFFLQKNNKISPNPVKLVDLSRET